MKARRNRAFTLVEILIVVIILGILAAVVVPQFTSASEDAAVSQTQTQLQSLRNQIELFRSRNNGTLPAITEGATDANWGEIIGTDYLRSAPVNTLTGLEDIVFGTAPDDATYNEDAGWVYDPATGGIWAGGLNGSDEPAP